MAVGTDGTVTDEAVVGGAVVAGNVEDTVTAVVDGGGVVDAGGGIGTVVVASVGTVDAMSSSPPQADIHMPVVATSVTPPRRLRSFTATPSRIVAIGSSHRCRPLPSDPRPAHVACAVTRRIR
jgi:hypothetical protein